MKTPENPENQLPITLLDPARIHLTEKNLFKDSKKYPGIFDNTIQEVKQAIESGDFENIPPIIVFDIPKMPKSKLLSILKEYRKIINEEDCEGIDYEELVSEILAESNFLCYNGNRRLEVHKRKIIEVRCMVVSSQELFNCIPKQEKRVAEDIKELKKFPYLVDRNYELSYIALLNDVLNIRIRDKQVLNGGQAEIVANRRKERGNI